jgi:type IV secretory pathway component VirB8
MTRRFVVTSRYANYRISFDVDDRETRATVNSFSTRRRAEQYAESMNTEVGAEG